MKTDRMIYLVDETRDKILHEAKIMFFEKGIEATRMTELAEKTHMSRTSLYRYFLDKEFLCLAVFQILMEDIRNLDDRIKDTCRGLNCGLDRVETLLKLRWLSPDMISIYRFFSEFDTIFSESRISEEFRKEFTLIINKRGAADPLLLDYIKEGQKDGSIRADLDPPLFGDIINNGVRAMHHRLLLRGSLLLEFSGQDINRIMEDYLNILIFGVKK